jgi:hypothetical protein
MGTERSPGCAASSESSALFAHLAGIVYAQADFDEVYSSICVKAPLLVDGCDHASLMLLRRDRFVTVAISDEVARRVDELERANREGPCMDAIVDETPQLESDLTSASQWPQLAKAVVLETPVRGAAGFRIIIEENKVGALNLFSDSSGALTMTSMNQGIILASFAAVALAAVGNREKADTLAGGLATNREIGKAIGLMMAFHKVSDAAAYEILRNASQDTNLKVSDVARKVVDHHNTRRD